MTKEQYPKGWAVKPLKKVAEIQRKSVSAAKIESGTMYIGLEHIDGSGSFVNPTTVNNGELASTKFIFGPDHLLYGKLRPYLKKIVRPSFSGVCSTDILPILPDNEVLDRNYLYYYLRQTTLINLATARSTGANLPRLSPKTLSEFPVLLPPLAEQKRIAAILDKADAIRRKRQDAIALADTFLRSVFLKMFGDPVTNPMGWDEEPFDELVPTVETGWSPKCESYPAQEGEIGVLKLGAITRCSFLSKENKLLPSHTKVLKERYIQPGDVLFSRKNTRELVAACAIAKDIYTDLIFPDLMFKLVPNDELMNRVFLWGVLTHPGKRKEVQALAGGAAGSMPNISKKKLSTVLLPVPSIENQAHFERIYDDFQRIMSRCSGSLAVAENLFSSLQQRAFRGDL